MLIGLEEEIREEFSGGSAHWLCLCLSPGATPEGWGDGEVGGIWPKLSWLREQARLPQ